MKTALIKLEKFSKTNSLAAKSKSSIRQDNAELNQEHGSCKCVEHIEAVTLKG